MPMSGSTHGGSAGRSNAGGKRHGLQRAAYVHHLNAQKHHGH
jgi:hypothetical protein